MQAPVPAASHERKRRRKRRKVEEEEQAREAQKRPIRTEQPNRIENQVKPAFGYLGVFGL